MRETLIGCLLHLPQWGTKPATQACTLTWNHPATLQFITQYSNQLSHTGQGHSTYWCIHWLIPVCALTGMGPTTSALSGWCSSQLSNLASAESIGLFCRGIYTVCWHRPGDSCCTTTQLMAGFPAGKTSDGTSDGPFRVERVDLSYWSISIHVQWVINCPAVW